MFCEDKYVARLVEMKKAGHIKTMLNIVNYDVSDAAAKKQCTEVGLHLYNLNDLLEDPRAVDTDLS